MGLHRVRAASLKEFNSRVTALQPSGKKLSQHSALQLICLDYLQWLRNGRDVAEKLHCSQSCVSRQSRSCLELFELQARKRQGELRIEGNLLLLRESRRLHQLFRISGLESIRIEVPPSFVTHNNDNPSKIPIAFACTAPRKAS